MKSWLEHVRARTWWQLLLVATAGGIISGLTLAMLGVFGSPVLGAYLIRPKETTELGEAVLAIYAFLSFAATGFVAAFSGIYGIARRSRFIPLTITCIALSINLLGFFVPTGGYALLAFYASVVVGVGLTVLFLALPLRHRLQTNQGAR